MLNEGNFTAKELILLLNDLNVALDDWVATYAAEMCDSKKVAEARARIEKNGGMLAYIAKLSERIDKALFYFLVESRREK